MGLKKDIVQPNGVTVSYHRIVSIGSIINQCTTIELASYISYDGRINEIDFLNEEAAGYEPSTSVPYIASKWYTLNYIDGLTLSDAYNKVKEMPEFEGAEDVIE